MVSCAPTPAPLVAAAPTETFVVSTPAPTLTPIPLPTATKTTSQAIFPYTIEGLRGRKFTGGQITFRELILETEVFSRYLLEYTSEGLGITAVLQIPKSGKAPYPVIMMNHGFFSRAVYQSGDGTDRAAAYLNQRGYITLASDYRSWAKTEYDISLFYSGLVIDVINLMNAIPQIEEADPQRIGMWGHSMGGGVTLKVLTIDPRVKAAVLYNTVSGDFADLIARWGPGCLGSVFEGEQAWDCNSSDILPQDAPQDLIDAYYKVSADAELLKSVSPLYHLTYVTAPVQIAYGTEDGKVSSGTPPEWSKKIHEELLKAGKNSQLFAYPEEGHSFSPKEWFPFMQRTVWFFDKYVRP